MMGLVYGFKRIPSFSSEKIQPTTRFSVVIPFRNEAENLPNLLKTIRELNYPLEIFEIIFVNDASEDNSEAIILKETENSPFSIKLIQNKRTSNSPKKDAISEAIQVSQYNWIVTTDADCQLPPGWLRAFDFFLQTRLPNGLENDSVLVAGPVEYTTDNSFTENFQELDGMSLQMATIGSFGLNYPLLSNGANLAYRKDAFLKVNGFIGNNHIASGDDIFILEKMKKAFPGKVKFLKSREAIVLTKPQKTWKNVVRQRIRWASKTSKQKNLFSVLLGILVFLVNLSLLVIPFLIFFQPENSNFYLSFLALKVSTDYISLYAVAWFFGKKVRLPTFLAGIYIYALLISVVVIGSPWGSYVWKGRAYEKSQ